MPTEIRRVIFGQSELMDAIGRYNSRQKQAERIPPGVVDSCRVHDDEDGIVHLDIRDVDGNHTIVALKHAMVGAALMQYCRDVKIPLPKRGKKSLVVMGENIALAVDVMTAPEKVPERPPPIEWSQR